MLQPATDSKCTHGCQTRSNALRDAMIAKPLQATPA
jgi:hypothetical protein